MVNMKQISLQHISYFNSNGKLRADKNQRYLKANLSNTEKIIDSHDQLSLSRFSRNLRPRRFSPSSFYFCVLSIKEVPG